VLYRTAIYDLEQAGAVLARYRESAPSQPDDVHAVGTLKTAADARWIPQAQRGRPALVITAIATDAHTAGASPFGELFAEKPAAFREEVMPYADLQKLGDYSEPHGHLYFTKSCYLGDISADAAAELVTAAEGMCSPLSAIDFEYLRGAISSEPAAAESSFPGRHAPYLCTFSAHWKIAAHGAENVSWARKAFQKLIPYEYGGGYVNYVQDRRPGGSEGIYGPEIHRRLSSAKAHYDRGNIFHHNQNICPV
jgi:hypothetical protein